MSGFANVVTAYYDMKSKRSSSQYMQWILQFWPATRCPLVFFTSPELAPEFQSAFRGRQAPTIVAVLRLEDFNAFKILPREGWEAAQQVDPEAKIHSPELYAIWFEKKEFVRRAIALNPFPGESDRWVWADAGICRTPAWIPILAPRWPQASEVPAGKMLLLQMSPFQEGETTETDFTMMARIGGGLLASDAAGWACWSEAYDTVFHEFLAAGRFIGKDQSLMAVATLKDPTLSVLQSPIQQFPHCDQWFSLLFVLAKVQIASK
jgi:hypothetical protein